MYYLRIWLALEASHLYVHAEFWEVPRLKRDKNNNNIVRFTLVGGLPLPWFTLFLYEDLKLQGARRIKFCDI